VRSRRLPADRAPSSLGFWCCAKLEAIAALAAVPTPSQLRITMMPSVVGTAVRSASAASNSACGAAASFSHRRDCSFDTQASRNVLLLEETESPLTLVEEDFRMLAAPTSTALAIFADDDSESHASATVTLLTSLAQLQHLVT
jgi:hypothetical protein